MRGGWVSILALILWIAVRPASAGAMLGESGPGPTRLILVADPWCPYNCDPATGREGYMVDLARAILEPMGYSIDYRVVTWAVALRLVEEGHADGIIGAGRDEAVALVPSSPLGRSAKGVLSRTGYPFAWSGVDSFRSHRLAVIRGYRYGEMLDGYIAQNADSPARITTLSGFGYNQLTQAVRLLLAGQVDLVVDDVNVLSWKVDQFGLRGRTDLTDLGDAEDVFIALSPRRPNAKEVARLLDDGIHRLRQEGRLAAILDRYGLKDWAVPANAH